MKNRVNIIAHVYPASSFFNYLSNGLRKKSKTHY